MLSCLHALPGPSRDILRAHVRRSAEGMIEVVARSGADRVLRLGSIPELRDYCYVVAGIVGEMLTELFLLNHPRVAPARDYLRARSRLFGEGAAAGEHPQGRRGRRARGAHLHPAGAAAEDVMALAREDLRAASRVHAGAAARTAARPGWSTSTRCWCGWRSGTLAAIEARRPGNKLSRVEVLAIIAEVVKQVDQGQPPLPADGLGRESPGRRVNARAGAGALLAAVCLAAAARPAVAKTRFFPLPMYTTVPNEGSTYGVMPVFMVAGRRRPGSGPVHHRAQPELEQLGRRHRRPYRYYRYLELLRSWHLLVSASTNINRSLWFTYDDDRAHAACVDAERPGAGAPQPLLPILRARPRHDGRGGVELHAAVRDRERARRVERDLQPQPGASTARSAATVRSDTPSRGCPRRRMLYPDAPGLDGAALRPRRAWRSLRHARAGRLLAGWIRG